jgi:hypothetical protein
MEGSLSQVVSLGNVKESLVLDVKIPQFVVQSLYPVTTYRLVSAAMLWAEIVKMKQTNQQGLE